MVFILGEHKRFIGQNDGITEDILLTVDLFLKY